MKGPLRLLMTLSCFVISLENLQAQPLPSKGPPPPTVWGPQVPGTDPPETNECVRKCNAKFEQELMKCLALESAAQVDCERPVRERHRACFTGCPK